MTLALHLSREEWTEIWEALDSGPLHDRVTVALDAPDVDAPSWSRQYEQAMQIREGALADVEPYGEET